MAASQFDLRAIAGTARRTRQKRLASAVAALSIVTGAVVSAAPPVVSAIDPPDSLGTDFWLAFPGNLEPPELTLFITGPSAATGTVAAPGVSFSAPFTVTPGTVTSVSLPSSLDIQSSDTVEDLGIHVTATSAVTVYGLNRVQFTTDAYLGLPTDILGKEYLVEGYMNVDIVEGTEFAIVATQDATVVTINPTVTTDGHTAGTPYTVALNQGQTYQLRNTDVSPADLSGSIVTSDKPIAVFGGHQCANIPAGNVACDHIVEEITPTTTWGKSFVTEPLATRNGDTFRYLADTDGTTVKVNGVTVATLNRGQIFEQILTAASVITSDKPILVTQYSNSSSFDGVTSDPFEVVVPPFEQFQNSYTVTTPATGFSANYLNVVAPTASLGTVKLDGAVIPGATFTAIPGSAFSGAQLAVDLGSHTLEGARPFGVIVYGFADFDSYGYPGGLSLAPVATVSSISLAPKTATNPINTQHCVSATVKDQNSAPVVGVRVDFAVTGVNPTSGFSNTIADGTAGFCYTGANTGDDKITATVSGLSDTAAKTWTSVGSTNTVVSYTGPASVQYSDPLALSGHLQTSTGTPIPGQTLGFVLGTDNKSAGPTDASGNATAASFNELQQPGSATSVAVNFAGNATTTPPLLGSTATAPFSITKEDCTIAYTGETLVNAGDPTTLSAQFGEFDSAHGDWANKTVTFTVTDAASNVQTFTATTNASGVASTTAALDPNVYGVGVSFAGDAFYLACSTATDTVVTVQSATAKITGGGWISQDTGRTSFGFNVMQAGDGLRGQLQIRVRNGKDRFHSTVVLTLSVSGNSGTWTGTGRWNKADGYSFTVSVLDNGGSGKRGDMISIVIRNTANQVVFTTSGLKQLKGGNIVVH
jgi:hypothetical protein